MKLKKCKVCQKEFKVQRPMQAVCSPKCAYQQVKKDRLDKKTVKQNDRSWLNYKINSTVQEIARIIDYGQKCLARPNHNRNGISEVQFHGGHCWSKGGHPECKWNLHNIHAQNAGSNNKGSDDHLMFVGLEKRYGERYRKFVENLANKKAPKHTIQELKDIYQRAKEFRNDLKKKTKEQENLLNNGHEVSKLLELRNEGNTKLKIYDKKESVYQREKKTW